MSHDTNGPDRAAPPSLCDWVDEVADRFDAAWQRGPRPAIASFLGGEQGSRRLALLEELLRIDLECRWKAGERPDMDDYRADFPELFGGDGSPPADLTLYAGKLRQRFGADPGPEPVTPVPPENLCCPHCRNPIPLGEPAPPRVACPSCGASFRLDPALRALVPAADLPRPLGKFRLLELRGCGSFGAVYRARDTELDRVVAVKVPRAGCFATPEEEARFLREARSAGRLTHPGIVPVHEIAYQDGLPYIVSDYVEGRTLAALLAERRPGFREAAELTAQVADALDYAHQHRVVHRDVSPRNVLLDAAGRPHLTDFGLARRDEGSIVVTREGQILGTPAYMSPEQAAGEPARVDARSDVYSLGVILYELLTGELPFRGTITTLLRQVVEEEPRPPRKLNDRLPRDLETICLKAMAKAPARRYQTAGDLAADLRRWLKGEPIRARPVGNVERTWRWCRRNPAVAGLIGTALLSLIVGAAVSGYFAVAERTRAREALESAGRADQEKKKAKRESANLALERGRNLSEQGEGGRGLLWAARSLELAAEAEDTELAAAIRANLADLYRRTHPLRLVLPHPDAVLHLAVSPDGHKVLAGCPDSKAHLWDVSTEPPRDLVLPQERVHAVAFSPDGETVLAGGDTESWLRETASGHPRVGPLRHPARAQCAAFGPDGKTLLTGHQDGTACFWDAATGQLRARLAAHRGEVRGVAFSPDGKTLVTGSLDHTFRLWDAATGRPRGDPVRHPGQIWALALSPDGRTLLTGSSDGMALLWDAATGQRREPPLPHQGAVHAVAFSPDGKLLLTGSRDQSARLWDAATGRPRGNTLPHQGILWAAAFSPDGKSCWTADGDGQVRRWDVAADPGCEIQLPHTEWVQAVAFSPDGRTVLTGCYDKTARMWDAATGRPRGAPLAHPGEVAAAVFSPDGRTVLTGCHDNTARLWDATTGQARDILLSHRRVVWAVAFSPDGRALLTGSEDGSARLWDAATGRPRGEPLRHGGPVHAVTFSPDGETVLTGSADKTARLWDAATGRPRGEPLAHPGEVLAVAFSPDFRTFLTGSLDATVRTWDTATGRPRGTPLSLRRAVTSLAFSADGRRVLTGSYDGNAQVWHVSAGQALGNPLPHPRAVLAVAFSPDGRSVLTGSEDGGARVWRLPAPVDGDPARIMLWAQTITGMELDRNGLLSVLDARTWAERWANVGERGGPPVPR
jgi:WD40 repeat protein